MPNLQRPGKNPDTLYPRSDEKHDVLVLTSARDLYRARRNRATAAEQAAEGRQAREFVTGLEKVGRDDDGHRKVTRVATTADSRSGFALLPFKQEPSTGAFSCYLVNEAFFGGETRDVPQLTLDIDQDAWVLAPKRVIKGISPTDKAGTQFVESEKPSLAGVKPPPRATRAADGDVTIALARTADGFEVDSAQVDFVNTWTRVDWIGAAEKKDNATRVYTSFVQDTNPSQKELLLKLPQKPGIYRARLGADRMVAVAGEPWAEQLTAAMSEAGAILGTVNVAPKSETTKMLVPYLNLAEITTLAPQYELLLAFPDGNVHLLTVDHEGTLQFDASPLKLREHPEVWRLLRNGIILGDTKWGENRRAVVLNNCSLKGDYELTLAAQASRVAGTLDFKWNPRQTIEIAFQADTGLGGLSIAREWVESAFRTWLKDTSLAPSFSPKDATAFPSPGAQGDSGSMPFYDVLINLDTLPQYVPATTSDKERFIDFPVSELGSYALRRRLGAPTMYLGWLPQLKPNLTADPFPDSLAYFRSDMFKHLTLHEVGHALGIPHLNQAHYVHQNGFPRLSATQEIQDFILKNHGVQLAYSFIDEELLRDWEFTDDDRFNEWPAELTDRTSLNSTVVAATLADSIMVAFPVLAALRISSAATAGQLVYRTTPTELDLRWIKKLYPR